MNYRLTLQANCKYNSRTVIMNAENKNISKPDAPELQENAQFSIVASGELLPPHNTIGDAVDLELYAIQTGIIKETLITTLHDLNNKGYLNSDEMRNIASTEFTTLINTLFQNETQQNELTLKEVSAGRDVILIFPNGKTLHFLEGAQLDVIRALARRPLSRTEFRDMLPQVRKDMSANVSTYLKHMRKRLADADYTVEEFHKDNDTKETMYRFKEIVTEKPVEEVKPPVEIKGTLFTFSDGVTLDVIADEVMQTLNEFIDETGMIPNFELGKRLFGEISDEASQDARRYVAKTNRVIAEVAWRIINTEPRTKDQLWQLQKVAIAKEIEETYGTLLQQVLEPTTEVVAIPTEDVAMEERIVYEPIVYSPEESKETKVLSLEKRIPSIRNEVRNNIATHFTTNLNTYSVGQLRSVFKISIHSMRYLQENDYVKPEQRGSGWEDHPAYTPEEVVAVAVLKKYFRKMTPQMIKQLEIIISEEMKIAVEKRADVEIQIHGDEIIISAK